MITCEYCKKPKEVKELIITELVTICQDCIFQNESKLNEI